MWRNEVKIPQEASQEGRGIPKQEFLVLSSTTISVKQLKRENSHVDQNLYSITYPPMVAFSSLYTNESPLALAPTHYGFLHQMIFPPFILHCLPKWFTPFMAALLTWSNLNLSSCICPLSHWKVQNLATLMIPFILWGILLLLMGLLTHFIHLLDDTRKINVPISFMLIFGTLHPSCTWCFAENP